MLVADVLQFKWYEKGKEDGRNKAKSKQRRQR